MTIFDQEYNGKYETDHIHMVLEEDVPFPVDNNVSDQKYGLLVHEYIHYYQHFGSLYGSQFCKMSNMLFLATKNYLQKQKKVKLPFGIWEHDSNINHYVDHLKRVEGSKSCGHSIDDIEICDKEIETAINENRSVHIGIYDKCANDFIKIGFSFGYYCIIEYMAHAIQKMIYSEVKHNKIPYTAVELICQKRYPEIVSDKKQLITMCLCALMYDNPGARFFSVLNFSKEHPSLRGLDFYKEFIQTSLVNYKGRNYAMDYIGIEMLEEYKKVLENQCGCKLKYYNKVIDSFKQDYKTGECGLLKWLYDGDVKDREQFRELVDAYGCPFIEMPGKILMTPYKETAALIGFELLYRRLQKLNGDECPWYHICKRTQYEEDTKVDEYCGKEQWKKRQDCLMTRSLKYFQLDTVEIIA